MEYFLHTIALPVATLLTVAAQAIGLWIWSKKHDQALKANTELTRKGVQIAAIAADKADTAAQVAQTASEETKVAINGRVDQWVQAAYEKGLAEGKLKKDEK